MAAPAVAQLHHLLLDHLIFYLIFVSYLISSDQWCHQIHAGHLLRFLFVVVQRQQLALFFLQLCDWPLEFA
jgi:hypothetical protein